MADRAEHAEAEAAARDALARSSDPRRPLSELPPGFAATRASMHALAEGLLKPKRVLETGNEIALCFTPGGFGTPEWDGGDAKEPGYLRVEGCELVSRDGNRERRWPLDQLSGAPDELGVPSFEATAPIYDEEGAAALAAWFAFGTVVLANLVAQHEGAAPAPVRLWPEHFDVATDLGDSEAGKRANFGASPGDEDHAEPYLYIGPWDDSVSGEFWNASAFTGAELTYGDLRGADDQVAAAAQFFERGIATLG